MKTKNCILALLLMFGLPAAMLAAPISLGITAEDCASIFSSANSCEKTKELAPDIVYGEAWHNGSWETTEEFFGYVFLKSLQHEGKTIQVLVGMTKTGAISKVRVKGVSGVDEEFLDQFRGKTSQSNFGLARTPEDLLFIPAKIKAMQGNLSLSERIVEGVKEIATSANKVIN